METKKRNLPPWAAVLVILFGVWKSEAAAAERVEIEFPANLVCSSSPTVFTTGSAGSDLTITVSRVRASQNPQSGLVSITSSSSCGGDSSIWIGFSRPVRNLRFRLFALGRSISGAVNTFPPIVPEGQTNVEVAGPLTFLNVGVSPFVDFGIRSWTIRIDTLSVETADNEPEFFVKFQLSTDADSPASLTRKVGTGMVTAKLGLGTFIEKPVLTIKRGPLEPEQELACLYAITSQSVAPAYAQFGKHLHAAINLLPLGGTPFPLHVAVHLGQADIRMTPVDPRYAAVTLRVKVVEPRALGDRENVWDPLLTKVAHERGIPPQYLKGQAEQESPEGRDFERESYRYEPCGGDAGEITGQRLLNHVPYSLYRLDAAIGDTLPDQTFRLRERYYLPVRDPAGEIVDRVRIAGTDRNVKAKEIFLANNKWPVGGTRGMNWHPDDCGVIKAYQRQHPDADMNEAAIEVLDFVAQTSMAASFGMFQVMYYTAVRMGWKPKDPETGELPLDSEGRSLDRDPFMLQDTEANHRLEGGGSLWIGSEYDARNYGSSQTSFLSREAYRLHLVRTFQAYNSERRNYGSDVVNRAKHFLPAQPLVVF